MGERLKTRTDHPARLTKAQYKSRKADLNRNTAMGYALMVPAAVAGPVGIAAVGGLAALNHWRNKDRIRSLDAISRESPGGMRPKNNTERSMRTINRGIDTIKDWWNDVAPKSLDGAVQGNPASSGRSGKRMSGRVTLDSDEGTVDTRIPEARPGPDGTSPVARSVGDNVDVQRDAWESMLRGNPDLAKTLRESGQDKFKPWSAGDQQRALDSVHQGSGFRSNGLGGVWDGPGSPPPGDSRPDGFRGSNLSTQQARQFASADSDFRASRAAGQMSGLGGSGSGSGTRGWSNQARANAYVSRMGNLGKTPENIPYGLDYVEPTRRR